MAFGSDTRRQTSGSVAVAFAAIFIALSSDAQAQTNLALNRPATAAPAPQFPPGEAFDANMGSRWASAQGLDPQWIYVDLGTASSITRVVLTWETASAKAYQIQTSADAINWASIYSTTTGDGGTDDLTGLSGTGRYVRMNGTVRNTAYGYSLWEFAIYGGGATATATVRPTATSTTRPTPTVTARPTATSTARATATSTTAATPTVTARPTPTPTTAATATSTPTPSGSTNVALNKGATASSQISAPGLAFDGNAGTRWESVHAVDPQWIYVDLGATYNITRVVLTWETASAKAYQIQTSSDATNWANIYTTTTSPGGAETLNITGSGRYVRMYGTVRSTAYGYSLWEFAVYGTTGATPTATVAPRATATSTMAATPTSTTAPRATATPTTGAVQCYRDSDCVSPQVCGHAGQCQTKAALTKSNKRGVPNHFCGSNDSRGGLELDALKTGISWYYNWASGPQSCDDPLGNDAANSVKDHPQINNFADGTNGVEFVPMIWGFAYGVAHNGLAGANCADSNNDQIPDGPCFRVDNAKGSKYCWRTGGPCLGAAPETAHNPKSACYECEHEVITYNELLNRMPLGSKYLLGLNEPNFFEQASMSPVEAAAMWKYVEKVADARGLKIVSPAVNYCGPTHQGGTGGAGECTAKITGGTRDPQLFAYLDEFYYECQAGKNGRTGSGNYSAPNVGNCKVDYNAHHVYSSESSQTWTLTSIANWRNHTDTTFSVRINTDAFVQAQANKPYWVTEYAPEYTGIERNTIDKLNDNVNEFEVSPDIFRYAWFMVRVSPNMKALDLDDLACATKNTSNVNTSTITNVGQCYLKHPIGVRNVAGQPGYVNECDFLNHPVVTPTYCCDDNFHGVCLRGMLKTCGSTADCGDANSTCVLDASTTGVCKAKSCTLDTECANGYVCDGENAPWPGACRPWPHPLNSEPAHQ